MSNVVLQSEDLMNLVSPAQTSGSDDGGLLNAAGLAKLEKVIEVLVIRTIHRVFGPTMEDLVRRVVRKELEEAQSKLLGSLKGNPENESHTPNPRFLKLKFQQSVSDPVLTGKEIKGKGGCVLQVALLDDLTEEVVDTESEASAEIEIVALQGELDDADEDNQVFDKYIKRVNNANKSLLVGKVCLKLNKGIGNLQNVKFRHCSNWMNNCKYKLGARVVGTFSGTVVKEAKTESFTVKDRRGQYYKKHDSPCLSDDVWRLKNIGRDGNIYRRLKEQRVETVEDFLVLLLRDSEQLKSILHIAQKLWMETVSHARRCKIDERVYLYTDSQNTGVVFDLFGEVLGLVLQCQYRRTETLSMDEKANALKLKESACSHWEDIDTFSDERSFVQHLSKLSLSPSDSLSIECHNDREVINEYSYSPQDATFQSIANSGQDFGSTSLTNVEVLHSPIHSPGHHDFMTCMEEILNDNCNIMFEDAIFGLHANQQSSANISMFDPPQDGSFPKVHALKHWRMVSLKVHALNHWRTVFKVVKFKRKRAENLVSPDIHVQKRHKSFGQDYAIK